MAFKEINLTNCFGERCEQPPTQELLVLVGERHVLLLKFGDGRLEADQLEVETLDVAARVLERHLDLLEATLELQVR